MSVYWETTKSRYSTTGLVHLYQVRRKKNIRHQKLGKVLRRAEADNRNMLKMQVKGPMLSGEARACPCDNADGVHGWRGAADVA